ncbi:MAG: hypothetical protein JNL11_00120 [Bdellovibrionaceae bacterium]|nr:hypothetical protein [Pseudobdellovibrionaceae bacterium]
MKSLRLFVVTIFIFAFNAIAITGDLSELMSTYSGEMNTARQALPNPNQLTGYQRYLFAFDTRGKDADQKIARLLVVVQEQEKLVKYYINEKSANDLFMSCLLTSELSMSV